jgi:ribosomal protein S18 acetylase RimI-like enzyme
LLELLPPELVLLAEVGGQTVGMSLTLLDFNEAMRPLNGKLFKWGLPLGLLQFFRNCRKVKTARLVALGVLNDYRRRGISELLILRTMESASQHCGITHAELGWTLEDNTLINQAIEAVGATHYKTFRIYEKELENTESGKPSSRAQAEGRKAEPR